MNTTDNPTGLITDDVISVIYHAKCNDLHLIPTAERLERFAALLRTSCAASVADVKETGFGVSATKILCDFLCSSERYHTLVLASNSIGDEGAASVAKLIAANNTLVAIDLKGCEIGNKGNSAIFEAITNSRTLTSIDLSGVAGSNRNRMGIKSCSACSECVAQNPVFAVLRLRETGLDSGCMQCFIEKDSFLNCTLQEIDLSLNPIGREGVLALTEATLPHLTTLSLAQCDLLCEGACEVAETIRRNHFPCLTSLDMSDNKIASRGAAAIATVLEGNSPTLRALTLNGNPFTIEGCSKIFTALVASNATPLRELGMSYTGMCKDGAIQAATFVSGAKILEKLDISGNDIGDDGCCAMATALIQTSTLTWLSLASNHIGDIGGCAIADVIGQKCSLSILDLSDNRLLSRSGEKLAFAMENNNLLRKMPLDQSDIRFREYDRIVSRLQENKKRFVAGAQHRLRKEAVLLQKDEEELLDLNEKLAAEERKKVELTARLESVNAAVDKAKTEREANLKSVQDQMVEANKNMEDTLSRINILARDLQTTKTEREMAYKNTISKQQKEKDNCAKLQKQLEKAQKEAKALEAQHYDEIYALNETLKKTTEEKESLSRQLQQLLEDLQQQSISLISSGDSALATRATSLLKNAASRASQAHLLTEAALSALQGKSKGNLVAGRSKSTLSIAAQSASASAPTAGATSLAPPGQPISRSPSRSSQAKPQPEKSV
eukprot:TRINITY_DN7259_c0_g1_i1.p1 TRINITY_DN7259_c0_g1~~TRINITY_DN7259_c0_g1_i1.p1  ORF type:complete len:735 (+),score=218.38 TRINITY_DN7259_c0_g1_i1:32-2206(+)